MITGESCRAGTYDFYKKKYFLRVSINLCEFYSKSILIFSLFMIYVWVLLITYNVDKINDFTNSYKKLYSFK